MIWKEGIAVKERKRLKVLYRSIEICWFVSKENLSCFFREE
jgi:hypothetical protein